MMSRYAMGSRVLLASVGVALCGCAGQRQPSPAAPVQTSNRVAEPASTTVAPTSNPSAIARAVGGPGGGWIIAARPDLQEADRVDLAKQANQRAEERPARPADARAATTADLNNDGFVTLDELIAMHRAGISDNDTLERLARTGQVFKLSDRQQQYLRDRDISQAVIDGMLQMSAQPVSAAATGR